MIKHFNHGNPIFTPVMRVGKMAITEHIYEWNSICDRSKGADSRTLLYRNFSITRSIPGLQYTSPTLAI